MIMWRHKYSSQKLLYSCFNNTTQLNRNLYGCSSLTKKLFLVFVFLNHLKYFYCLWLNFSLLLVAGVVIDVVVCIWSFTILFIFRSETCFRVFLFTLFIHFVIIACFLLRQKVWNTTKCHYWIVPYLIYWLYNFYLRIWIGTEYKILFGIFMTWTISSTQFFKHISDR